jgi:hypothetical protein
VLPWKLLPVGAGWVPGLARRDGGMTSWTMTTDRPTRVVTYAHRPKRAPRKKAKAAAITVPAIVKAAPMKAQRKPWVGQEAPPDIKAFLTRMGVRPRDD